MLKQFVSGEGISCSSHGGPQTEGIFNGWFWPVRGNDDVNLLAE